MADPRQFYEWVFPTPIEVTGIGSTAKPLFQGQPSKYWTDITIMVETMGSNTAIYVGDQNAQLFLVGSQANQYWVWSIQQPNGVMNVSRFWIKGDNAAADGKVWVMGIDPQIEDPASQVINRITQI